MALLLSVILAQADASKEIAELIRSLQSDSADEREQATGRLKEIGAPAVKPLQAALKATDPELRGRAAGILEHFARLERIRVFRGSGGRVSLDLRERPLAEAVKAALVPLGLTGASTEPGIAGKPVTLALEKAPFWEAVERLEKAAGARIDPWSGVFRPEPWTEGSRPGAGEVRVGVSSWGSFSRGGGPNEATINVKAWLPPGAWACAGELAEIELTDGSGKAVEHSVHPGLGSVRRDGLPSDVGAGFVAVRPAALKGVRSVSLKGTLKIGFPRDVGRIDAPAAKLPSKLQARGGSVTLNSLKEDGRGSWEVNFGGEAGPEALVVLLSVEDGAGRWLGDLYTLSLRPGSSMGVGTSVRLPEGAPARWSLTWPVGTETVTVPFSIPPIDVPEYLQK